VSAFERGAHRVNWRAPGAATSACGCAAQRIGRVTVGISGPRDTTCRAALGEPALAMKNRREERRAPDKRGITVAAAAKAVETTGTATAQEQPRLQEPL